MSDAVEYDDIQSLVRFAHAHLTQASFLLLHVKDRAAARAWLASAPVTSAAVQDTRPDTALHVALTRQGLDALGVPADIVSGFSAEYLAGMTSDEARSRRLGDIAQNDPSGWLWGGSGLVPHVLVMLYARPELLADFERGVVAACDAGFELSGRLATTDMDGVEPFGFVDGISQPEPDWARKREVGDITQYAYTNLSCLGEFLLGYPNEYGAYTDRPLLDPARSTAAQLPRAEEAPDLADLGRNGSYLVMRQLRQDVRGLWQYLDAQAGGNEALRRRWGEAMVGRKLTGEPLVGSGSGLNDFDYQTDVEGLRCPFGAHIRRANPRNADLPEGPPGLLSRLVRIFGFNPEALEQDRIASTRFHRLLRRGREYGVELSIEQAVTTEFDPPETGLHFICLGANIARQFEFVQNAWIIGTRFDGLGGEGDPLLGDRQPGPDRSPTNFFSIPEAGGPDRRLHDMPAFVQVRGGAYFFLPGLRALKFLATVE
jgi:deferrochelatase/peroxidase EfeB